MSRSGALPCTVEREGSMGSTPPVCRIRALSATSRSKTGYHRATESFNCHFLPSLDPLKQQRPGALLQDPNGLRVCKCSDASLQWFGGIDNLLDVFDIIGRRCSRAERLPLSPQLPWWPASRADTIRSGQTDSVFNIIARQLCE
eukprot:scaffold84377_cov75-Phaeocystis_antarctica.AAC.6